jgi:hypothetical protein
MDLLGRAILDLRFMPRNWRKHGVVSSQNATAYPERGARDEVEAVILGAKPLPTAAAMKSEGRPA